GASGRAGIVSQSMPTLAGSAAPGGTLTVVAVRCPLPISAFTYAWRRCNANGRICTTIPHATNASYVVTAADVGHTLVAVVSASVGASTQPAYSAATPPVA